MKIETQHYTIHLEQWAAVGNWIASQEYSHHFVLVDENSRKYCLPILDEHWKDLKYTLIAIPSGEENKILSTAQYVWDQLVSFGADRHSLMINLGGGVIGDLGGFCAASYMRGIDFIQIPTTLLSMTDASIGGKLGIDFKGYKNMIGLFVDPKSESYEICFVPDNDYRGFLKRRLPELEEKVKGGAFVNEQGELIGTHDGYPFYTIGQRKLGQAFGKPMYVTEIKPETNTVVLGEVDDLMRNGMMVKGVNSMKYDRMPDNIEVVSQVRYNDKGTMSKIRNVGDLLEVEFYANVRGVAPGQSAVFYEGDDVIGGGIIQSSLK